jgi:hypothetical protein
MGKKKSDPSARAQKNTTKLSLLVTIALSGIGTWRDFDSLYLCLVLITLALVWSGMSKKLWCNEVWWLGVFIAPTTEVAVGRSCCRRAHRTVRCATGHYPVRQPRHPPVGVRPLKLWQVVHQTVTVHYPVRHLRLLWLLRTQVAHCSSLFTFCRWPLVL